MKTVAFTTTARRSLRKLPEAVRRRILVALNRYAEHGEGDVKTLSGVRGARLRVGDYRVIFTEANDAVEVRAVGHRKAIYR